MKGIILAGGVGTRLYPITKVISKQILPVYDKPMIYYPLSVLMLAGINEIMVISTPYDLNNFEKLLGDGSDFGIKIKYAEQKMPQGIAQAFIIAEDFIKGDRCALILGDNIFYGNGLQGLLKDAMNRQDKALIFVKHVDNPERFGVVSFDEEGNAISIYEKPENPKSNYAVTGLYFYDQDVCKLAKTLKPSGRGELEITDLSKLYLQQDNLEVIKLGRGFLWMDAGTIESLHDASEAIRVIEKHQGIKIAVPEEIAYRNKWIKIEDVQRTADKYKNCEYGRYLMNLDNIIKR